MKRLLMLLIIISLVAIPIVSATENKTEEKPAKIKSINDSDVVWKDVTPASIKLPSTKSFTAAGKSTKFFQVYPGATIKISEDTETILQKTPERTELYYGYQNLTSEEPWTQYCRVEGNRVIYADFKQHRVWITPLTPERRQLFASDDIPVWGDIQ